ncbi:MAG: amidohydrolase family protein [Galactobacter sp.]
MLVQPPRDDADLTRYAADLGLPGFADVHVHFMPQNVLDKVWGFFDHVADDGFEPWGINYRTPEEERIRILRELGVVAYSALNYAHRPGMAAWLNDYSSEFARNHPDTVVPSGTFYPEASAGADTAAALAAGARIFKVHVQVGGYPPDDPLLDSSWFQLEEAGVPAVIHCGSGPHPGEFTGPQRIRNLLRKHPDLQLIIAHAGMPEYREFTALARVYPGVYLDTTMVGTDYMQRLFPIPEDVLLSWEASPDKIVLGTDFPNIPYEYAHQIQALERFGFGVDWMRAVLWENGAKLMRVMR